MPGRRPTPLMLALAATLLCLLGTSTPAPAAPQALPSRTDTAAQDLASRTDTAAQDLASRTDTAAQDRASRTDTGPQPPPPRSGTAPQDLASRTDTAPQPPPFWADPQADAARQVAAWRAEGRAADAELLAERIARHPTATWLADPDPVAPIRRAVRGAAARGQTVVLVAYRVPHRDCGLYSAGGARDAADYRRWIDRFADAIGDAPALVVLEPDAVPHILDGCTPPEHHAERYRLLSEAIARLKKQPRTTVYLDAGHPAFVTEPWRLVPPLMRAGIAKADGFAQNVSNFHTTKDVLAYGARLGELLGGKHFVLDTSRNGSGPPDFREALAWCNPPGRTLGAAPTRSTGHPLADAYLWVKHPGDSDGECRGGPQAGHWWPEYALDLARRS
ncbi:glycoside hydrolase family 6 protein [Streptomyces monticola]|uniref:Glucanase n=1 Tax=Streptomyces monticola TaxID=2666263 RepID=A0ABW2JLA9_9ACTN